MIIGTNTGSGGGGGGNVTELLAANTMQQSFVDLADGAHNIAAGAYRIRLYNSGTYDITVNGATVYPGETWTVEARENRVSTRFDLCPAVAIVIPLGGTASYQVEVPSA